MQAGSSLGFDLFSSLAAIDAWADDEDSDMEEEEDDSVLRRSNEDKEEDEEEDKEKGKEVTEDTHLKKTGYNEYDGSRGEPQSLRKDRLD